MQELVAINQITIQILDGIPDFFPIKPMDYGRFLVISVGTGSSKAQKKYSAQKAAKWGVLGWLLNGGSTPIVDIFTQASADMVDLHISVVFQAFHSQENYLRIQKPVSRVNLDSGLFEPIENGGTNEDALKKFAKLLSEEKRFRDLKSPFSKETST
ncbi:unnamed protein product [Fraxinus pennsylvanica]|uniref:Patatin n=1 Tax=Fraxinus pennsylvanica TaxID=56036 RepID=A0AAD2EC26_9LAMI|nr:unnamed protein product [Fraxinus pennsylvanica]